MSLLEKILFRKNTEAPKLTTQSPQPIEVTEPLVLEAEPVTAMSLRKQYKGMLYCFQAQQKLIEKMDVDFEPLLEGFENSTDINAVQIAYDDCYEILIKTAHIGGARSPYSKEEFYLVKDMLETSLKFFEHQLDLLNN